MLSKRDYLRRQSDSGGALSPRESLRISSRGVVAERFSVKHL